MQLNYQLFKIGSILMLIIFTLGPLKGQCGTGSSGGTNKYIQVFAEEALRLLHNSEISEDDRKVLKKAYDKSEIQVVDELFDQATHKSISNQKYIAAWGSLGLIQLKNDKNKNSNNNDESYTSWVWLVDNNQPIAHIVFHELYRASGIVTSKGVSPDDKFELSILKYHLTDSAGSANDNIKYKEKFIGYDGVTTYITPELFYDGKFYELHSSEEAARIFCKAIGMSFYSYASLAAMNSTTADRVAFYQNSTPEIVEDSELQITKVRCK